MCLSNVKHYLNMDKQDTGCDFKMLLIWLIIYQTGQVKKSHTKQTEASSHQIKFYWIEVTCMNMIINLLV